MRMHASVVLGLALLPTVAGAAEIPIYPVDANCREAIGVLFKGSGMSPARKAAFERDCVRRQKDAYDAVVNVWPALQAKDQQSCLHIVQTENYILLSRCAATLYAQEIAEAPSDRRPFQP